MADPQDPEWPLKGAVIHFQQAQGLAADGIAGPDTIIRLNTLSGRPNIPRIGLPN
jgi:peptidoglycan hydrolase-like protein with peptidoglycan-binding domain